MGGVYPGTFIADEPVKSRTPMNLAHIHARRKDAGTGAYPVLRHRPVLALSS
jgi:hypothetical protein